MCLKPCQGMVLDIRRSHLPASRPCPIFRRIDHDITERVFDLVVEIDIIRMEL